GRPVHVELLPDHTAGERTDGAPKRLVDRLDRDLLERDPGDVLRPEDVADLWIARHDHLRGSILARGPRAFLRDDVAARQVGNVFAEVPDRAVARLRVEVVRDLLDPAVEVRDVL